MIQAKNLSLSLSGQTLLQDVSLTVKQGEWLVILGDNGAGKSTLMKTMAGLLIPTQGQVEFLGQAIQSYNKVALARHLAYLAQHTEAYWAYTVSAFVALGAYPHRLSKVLVNKKVAEALHLFDLSALADQCYFNLSGGERQRAQLARIWMQVGAERQGLMLLDEPFNHIDQSHRQHICLQLRKYVNRGGSVVLVSHDWDGLSPYADCSRILEKP